MSSDTPSRVSPSATETQPVRIGPETPSIACEECGGLSRHYTDCSLFVELPRSPSSPVPSSAPEDFEKMLDEFEKAGIERSIARNAFHRGEKWVDDGRASHPTESYLLDADQRARESRVAIRGYVSRLRDERANWERVAMAWKWEAEIRDKQILEVSAALRSLEGEGK